MKTKQLNKNAVSTLAITSFIITMVAGAVVTGTLLAINYRDKAVDYITYQEAIDIASEIPEVAAFIQENDINSVSANREADIWIVEFFAENFNYTEDEYYWMNYAYVEINAINGEVIYFLVNSPTEPNLTEQEAIDLVLAIPEISDWYSTHPDAYPTAWYDSYELWYVNIYSNISLTYVMAIVSDWNSTVLWFDIHDPLNDAKHTEAEIITIVEALPEVIDWVSRNPSYERQISFRATIEYINQTFLVTNNDYNVTGGTWYIDYDSTTSADFIDIRIDDDTGDVISISTIIVPELTEAEAIAFAEAIPDVAAFLETITYWVNIEFNEYYGYWYIHFHNDNIYEEYAYVEVADPSGDILYYEINDIEDPNMTAQEAIDILLAVQEVQDWLAITPDYETHATFNDGQWFVYVLNTNNASYVPGAIVAYEALIDDVTGEILSLVTVEIMPSTIEVMTA